MFPGRQERYIFQLRLQLFVDPGLAYTNVIVPLNIIIGTVRLQKESPSAAECLLETVCDKIRRLSRLSVSGGVLNIRRMKGKSYQVKQTDPEE